MVTIAPAGHRAGAGVAAEGIEAGWFWRSFDPERDDLNSRAGMYDVLVALRGLCREGVLLVCPDVHTWWKLRLPLPLCGIRST